MRNNEYQFINFLRDGMLPDAKKKHYGSYMSFDDRQLSPGCMACKTGGWLCLFVGNKCNCTCPHCPNDSVMNNSPDISTASEHGIVDTDKILELLQAPFYTGVGISGGEPLLYIDKTEEWIKSIKRHYPNLYVWCYTNGLPASEDKLKRLADVGIDEIRFDLAAHDYSADAIKNMETAVKYIPSVGIEVPVFAEQFEKLLASLDIADSVGVKYVNLHDLYINETINKNGLGGYVRSYEKLSGIQRDIHNSIPLIYRAFRYIKDTGKNIIPNDCTLINMQLQTCSNYYQKIVRKENNKYLSFDDFMSDVLAKVPVDYLLLDKDRT